MLTSHPLSSTKHNSPTSPAGADYKRSSTIYLGGYASFIRSIDAPQLIDSRIKNHNRNLMFYFHNAEGVPGTARKISGLRAMLGFSTHC